MILKMVFKENSLKKTSQKKWSRKNVNDSSISIKDGRIDCCEYYRLDRFPIWCGFCGSSGS